MMKLTIDHREIEAKTGQTLLELVRALGLDSDSLATRPLAAKIAGETFKKAIRETGGTWIRVATEGWGYGQSFGYAVPIGLICAFVLKLPEMWVYFILCLDEFVKMPVNIWHYKKRGWLRNITREQTE